MLIEEVTDAMIRRRTFREERARTAAALLSYLGHPSPATERTLVEAAHDLEAAAALGGWAPCHSADALRSWNSSSHTDRR